MDKDTTNGAWLHALRQEFKAARRKQVSSLSAKLAELERHEKEVDFAEYRRREIKRIDRQRARFFKQPIIVNVEDGIFTRLVEAEALLAVAVGLFDDLTEDKQNWLFKHLDEINNARWALHNAVNDRELP